MRCAERKIVGWAKLGIFVSECDKMKIDKQEAFQRYSPKISQHIDNIYDSIDYIILIDGDCYFVGCFGCALCRAQHY